MYVSRNKQFLETEELTKDQKLMQQKSTS